MHEQTDEEWKIECAKLLEESNARLAVAREKKRIACRNAVRALRFLGPIIFAADGFVLYHAAVDHGYLNCISFLNAIIIAGLWSFFETRAIYEPTKAGKA